MGTDLSKGGRIASVDTLSLLLKETRVISRVENTRQNDERGKMISSILPVFRYNMMLLVPNLSTLHTLVLCVSVNGQIIGR